MVEPDQTGGGDYAPEDLGEVEGLNVWKALLEGGEDGLEIGFLEGGARPVGVIVEVWRCHYRGSRCKVDVIWMGIRRDGLRKAEIGRKRMWIAVTSTKSPLVLAGSFVLSEPLEGSHRFLRQSIDSSMSLLRYIEKSQAVQVSECTVRPVYFARPCRSLSVVPIAQIYTVDCESC